MIILTYLFNNNKFLLSLFLLIAITHSKILAQDIKWTRDSPSVEEISRSLSALRFSIDELIQIELSHERKGNELTVGQLEAGGFATLYFDYYYLYSLRTVDTTLNSFDLLIPIDPKVDKLLEVEVQKYTTDANGKVLSTKLKNHKTEKLKQDNGNVLQKLSLVSISPQSYYTISFRIRSVSLKGFKPNLIGGDIQQRESRLVIDIPDFIMYKSNYMSLDVQVHSIENSSFALKTFSMKDVWSHYGDSYTDYEPKQGKKLKLYISNPEKFYNEVYFITTSIDLPKKNNFGLDTNKLLTK